MNECCDGSCLVVTGRAVDLSTGDVCRANGGGKRNENF
jgi:hypothetical protein